MSRRALPTVLRSPFRLCARKEIMDKSFYRRPVPAVAIAVGIGVAAHRANANAAAALGVPVLAISLLVGLLLALFGMPGLGT
jgi:hypothetical protein